MIIIDGCPINCAEEIMKNSGFLKYRHINITDFENPGDGGKNRRNCQGDNRLGPIPKDSDG